MNEPKNIDDLRLWDANYNMGDVGAIVVMIRRFGWTGSPKLWGKQKLDIRAGNHSIMALRQIKAEGANPQLDAQFPPANVIVRDDGWYTDWTDISHLSESEAVAYAIADNKAAALASQDEALLASYLSMLHTDEDTTLFPATGYSDEELDLLVKLAADEIDFDHFDNPQDVEVWYRVQVEGLTRDQADELARSLPASVIKQYRVRVEGMSDDDA